MLPAWMWACLTARWATAKWATPTSVQAVLFIRNSPASPRLLRTANWAK
ncbi:hypothetical protein EVA_08384 [gut metagenome]|uniref:Uncharacterized protein n=1 Tax=gut metagenome TaxID=749906 RepID=J9GT80_9ZZZZ